MIPTPNLILGKLAHTHFTTVYTRGELNRVRYLDVGYGRDLFFYFFESRSKPSEDPVVMWINGASAPKVTSGSGEAEGPKLILGGPGCSSALGLFMELGTSVRLMELIRYG